MLRQTIRASMTLKKNDRKAMQSLCILGWEHGRTQVFGSHGEA